MDDIKHCPLCGRSGEDLRLTGHHIQTRRKSPDIVDMCEACHKAIHGLFTHQQIRDDAAGCDSVKALQKNPVFAKTLAFICRLPVGAKLKMAKRVGHTKYRGRKQA